MPRLASIRRSRRRRASKPQAIDQEYTAKIKEYTQDPRILTELVDHLPASATVPSPLKFLGRVAGMPDELTYYKDMKRYFEALAKAAPARTRLFSIGQSEEGRDMIVLAIADEATIKTLDRYKKILADLTDPRKLTETQARALIASGKPIYWATGNLHSGETGSAEMQMELAYRLIVEETPFIQTIRNNEIVFLTPVVEVDGREKVVDRLYYQKKTGQQVPLIWWGQYVAHDNNRDGLGVGLKLTENVLRTFLEWHPTVLHDLHESQDYLYVSTGAGPYNVAVDPVVTDEWWLIAKYEVAEMTKRGVPGVWTGTYYDGWTPNYLFWIANTHNSIGRFYETESYGPANREVTTNSSREWYRPNPPLPRIKWGPQEQRQHPAERDPVRDAVRCEEPRDVPRELLPEEQARDRARQERPAVCVDDPGRAAAPGRGREVRESAAPPGHRGAHGDKRLCGGRRAGGGRRLHRADGPAVQPLRASVPRHAVLRAGEPQPLRRHRVGNPAGAQREGREDRGQGGPGPADDDADG